MTDDWVDEFVNSPQRPHGPVRHKRKPGPAAKLRRDVIAAIQGLKHLGSRPVVVPVFSGGIEIEGKRYLLGRLGASDLVICWHGLFAAIELKAGRDTVKPVQAKFAERVQQAGGVYIVARRPQDAVDGLIRLYNERVAKLQPK